ncbi:MAG: cytochrome c biogenesis CcdA family protein [Actinomycetales bacterium]
MGLSQTLSDQVLTGSLLAALPIAALAGLVSFASPCVLPLVPGYLGYVTGLGGVGATQQNSRTRRRTMLAGALLFVLGFSLVFVLAGFTAGALGEVLIRWQEPLSRVLGVVVIVMGLIFLGVIPGGGTDKRLDWRPRAGLVGAPVLGVVFGLGWAPCIGPVFSAVALLSVSAGGATRGAILAFAYCLGLGIPFLLVAAGLGRGSGMRWLREHKRGVARFGGAMLVAVGLALVTGVWIAWVDQIRIWLESGNGFRTVI